MTCWTYFLRNYCLYAILGFFVRISYKHKRCYQFHNISLLFNHQGLACTPKDPPRRVDRNERSLISFYKTIYCVIDKTVWKPTLVKPFQTANVLFYLNIFGMLLICVNCCHQTSTSKTTSFKHVSGKVPSAKWPHEPIENIMFSSKSGLYIVFYHQNLDF